LIFYCTASGYSRCYSIWRRCRCSLP